MNSILSRRKSAALLFGLGAALLLPLLPAAAEEEAEPLLARAFVVRFRPLAEVAELIEPLLSEQGSSTMRPRLKTLVVEERASILERIDALIESYDLPPRRVEVTLSLFLGTDRRKEAGLSRSGTGVMSSDVRGVMEVVSDFTKWTAYEPLGSRSVSGLEGDRVVANLSDDYRVIFILDVVHERRGLIGFKSVSLQRLTRDESGEAVAEDLYTTAMVVPTGRLQVVGAASGADSSRALFLTLQAEPR